MIRTYSELIKLPTFKERFTYLMLKSKVGEETFGFDRYLNQLFYKSNEWQNIRNFIISRDNGCDLGIEDHPIAFKVLIHHMNPISCNEIRHGDYDALLNPEYLICTSHSTHNNIHYGDVGFYDMTRPVIRRKNDHIPWKRGE